MASTGRAENLDVTVLPAETEVPASPDLGAKGNSVALMLRDEPWNFQFFQAVRLLQRFSGGRQPVGRFARPDLEAVAFCANPALSFPASQIQSLDWPDGGHARMMVNFFGISGVFGVLPRPYSEYINERLRVKDTALQYFFDIFNHRALSLFYQAWEKYRFSVAYERDRDDRFTRYLLGFIGLGTAGLQNRQTVTDQSLIFYTGLLGLQPRSAAALKAIVRDYFGVPAEVDQFVGAWFSLEMSNQCRVGEDLAYSGQLGAGAVVGDEMWNQQSRARIVLGPLSMSQYLDFLPRGSAFASLRAITRFFSSDEIQFEVQLVLRREDVPALQLGGTSGEDPLLAWTTWVKNTPFQRDPGETILQLS